MHWINSKPRLQEQHKNYERGEMHTYLNSSLPISRPAVNTYIHKFLDVAFKICYFCGEWLEILDVSENTPQSDITISAKK